MNYICKDDIVMLVVIKPKPPSTKYIPLLNLAGIGWNDPHLFAAEVVKDVLSVDPVTKIFLLSSCYQQKCIWFYKLTLIKCCSFSEDLLGNFFITKPSVITAAWKICAYLAALPANCLLAS